MNYKVSDFKVATDVTFSATIYDKDNNTVPIDEDQLLFIMKVDPDDSDDIAILTVQADVISQGASGTGYFHLSSAETNIALGLYFYEFKWNRSNGEEKIFPKETLGIIKVLKRAWDISS